MMDPSLRVWNRSREKAAPLTDDAELGSVSVAEAGDLAECSITFLMLHCVVYFLQEHGVGAG